MLSFNIKYNSYVEKYALECIILSKNSVYIAAKIQKKLYLQVTFSELLSTFANTSRKKENT
jgi:hypothetical protein